MNQPRSRARKPVNSQPMSEEDMVLEVVKLLIEYLETSKDEGLSVSTHDFATYVLHVSEDNQ